MSFSAGLYQYSPQKQRIDTTEVLFFFIENHDLGVEDRLKGPQIVYFAGLYDQPHISTSENISYKVCLPNGGNR